jgi:hypothetical protein
LSLINIKERKKRKYIKEKKKENIEKKLKGWSPNVGKIGRISSQDRPGSSGIQGNLGNRCTAGNECSRSSSGCNKVAKTT